MLHGTYWKEELTSVVPDDKRALSPHMFFLLLSVDTGCSLFYIPMFLKRLIFQSFLVSLCRARQCPPGPPGPNCALGPRGRVLCVPVWPPDSQGGHQVRVAVLLPDRFYSAARKKCLGTEELKVEAYYKDVGPAILAGLEEAVNRDWLHNITFSLEFRDTQCNFDLAIRVWEDIKLYDLPHVIFGPSCNFALWSLASQMKIWNIPLLTAGGFSPMFSEPKTQPDDRFYLLTRTGVSYKDVARSFTRFMKENAWEKFVLVSRGQDHPEWGGDNSCGVLSDAVSKQAEEERINVHKVDLAVEESHYATSSGALIANTADQHYIHSNMTMLEAVLPPLNNR